MHNFGYVEIPTTNFKRAKKFFGTVFGWEFKDFPDIKYVTFKTPEQPHGGFMLVKKIPRSTQINVYVNVQDIDAKLKEIRKLRGKVVMKKSPVGTMGFMAQFETPEGVKMSLWENAQQVAAAPAPELTPQI